jgi:hypothetical protein
MGMHVDKSRSHHVPGCVNGFVGRRKAAAVCPHCRDLVSLNQDMPLKSRASRAVDNRSAADENRFHLFPPVRVRSSVVPSADGHPFLVIL